MSQQINLANPLLLKKRYALGTREMAIGLGVVLLAGALWAGVLHYQASQLETLASQQEAAQASAQAELDEASARATRGVSPLLTERVKATQLQVAQRETLLATLNGSAGPATTGYAQQLRALALSDTEGVWLNGFTLMPGYVEIKGSALNAGLLTVYIDRLGRQGPFAGLKFSGMTATEAAAGTKADAATPSHLDFTLYAGHNEQPGKDLDHAQ